jgi:hypothetical protein
VRSWLREGKLSLAEISKKIVDQMATGMSAEERDGLSKCVLRELEIENIWMTGR